ncbi:MAG: amino acid adenylation domain-containing protein [Oscillospiraceae bacterium]|jgi:amino acid adenylation domain-containing protein/non-ribosomal peptide synthase protein (TIGR01720 family)|nr:amino acid adenylation domain-containing protein [Oscillospiraceae bacterium]
MKYAVLQHYLDESFRTRRDSVCVTYRGRAYTYRTLQNDADRVTARLRADGCAQGTCVGVLTEDRYGMVAAMLGIWRAGCVFVPLEGEYPSPRLREMAQLSGMSCLLGDGAALSERAQAILPDGWYAVLENLWADGASGSAAAGSVETAYAPRDRMYVYFTSGTTGKPKPIVGLNESLAHFIDWEIGAFGLSEGVRGSQFTAVCHDPFLRDVLVPLCSGGTLCIPPEKNTLLSEETLTRWMEAERVQLVHCTPSLFSLISHDALTSGSYPDLRHVLLAGERLLPAMLARWHALLGDRVQLVNLYGPTETTLAKLFHIVRPEDFDGHTIPIGKPIPGAAAILLDSRMNVCPKGTVGEIYIRTKYASEAALSADESATSRFVPNPFQKDTQAAGTDLIFKTGDLAKQLEDGSFVFLSRVDRQVKIRGFRVELSEIENRLTALDVVKEAVVTHERTETADLLCAFLAPAARRHADWPALSVALSAVLPDYMVPQTGFVLESIPRTPNGKTDFAALDRLRREAQAACAAQPQNETERRILDIWERVLQMRPAGLDAPFFKAGGSSLSAMRFLGELHREFGVEVPLREIFERGSVSQLAAFVTVQAGGSFAPISPAEPAEWYPVSPAQKRMFMLDRLIGGSTVYNLPHAIRLEGRIDREALLGAVRRIVARHESLRTVFAMRGDEIMQHVCETCPLEMPVVRAAEDALDGVVGRFVRPFQLDRLPLLRVQLVEISEEVHYFLYDMHHIVSDGTSLTVFARELLQICAGQTPDALDIRYRDYVQWQREQMLSMKMIESEDYWLERFGGRIPVLDFPTDTPRGAVKTYDGQQVGAVMDEALKARLRLVADTHGVTLFTVLFSAFVILLHKYTGQQDMVVGTPVQGREHPALQALIGMFVSSVPLRAHLAPEQPVGALLAALHDVVVEALEHQGYPLETLISHLDIPRDTGRTPLFDMVFAYHDYMLRDIDLEGVRARSCPVKEVRAKFDVELAAVEQDTGLALQLIYDSHLFRAKTMERLMRQYLEILEQLDAPDIAVADIRLSGAAWDPQAPRGADVGYPALCVQQIFEDCAARYPDRVAVKMEGRSLTYRELNRRANALAGRLRALGVGADDLVPFLAPRSPEMIVGLYAIIKAGGAYVPVNPQYPPERIAHIIKECRAKVILTLDCQAPAAAGETVLSLGDPALFVGGGDNVAMLSRPDHLLYVIFTSGTTGRPKGVMIEHRNLVRLLFNDAFPFDFCERDVWLMFHSFCFDFSVWEIFGATLYGGTLVLMEESLAADARAVHERLVRERVTVLNQVPSAFAGLMRLESRDMLSLRYLIFGGEKLMPSRLAAWRRAHREVRIVNMYGITETTVHVTYKEITDEDAAGSRSNIGRAIPTLDVYLFDGDNPCGVGIPGEICVAGHGLARGYLNDPVLTAEKFVPNPLRPSERMYRSGDIGRWLESGEIEYLGRKDEQVQVRGYRVELGEIEHQLRQYDGVREVAAVAREYGDETKLTAYYAADTAPPGAALRNFLLERLPEYMVPHFFVPIDAVPLTANGKRDLEALPDAKDWLDGGARGSSRPTNPTEELLLACWQELLDLKHIGIDDNFFVCGGDSIKALQLVEQMRKKGLRVSLESIFQHQTIRALAGCVDTAVTTAEQGIVQGLSALTPIQTWFFDLGLTDRHHYNQTVLLGSAKLLDRGCVETALQTVALHHDALRMVFAEEDGVVRARNRGLEGALFACAFHDLTEDENADDTMRTLAQALQSSFCLAEGPLFKAMIVSLRAGDRLLLTAHHLVVDSISWKYIIEDFIVAYRLILEERPVVLPDKTDAYLLWANSLSRYFDRPETAGEIRYWDEKNKMGVSPVFPPPAVPLGGEALTAEVLLAETHTRRLLAEALRPYNTEVRELLLAALKRVLSACRGTAGALAVGLEGHGREDVLPGVDIGRTVGWFTSYYPLVLGDLPEESLEQTIVGVKEAVRQVPRRGVGYGILHYVEGSPRYRQYAMRPDVGFNYLGELRDTPEEGGFAILDRSYGALHSRRDAGPFALEINAYVENGRLCLKLTGRPDTLSDAALHAFAARLEREIVDVIEHCAGRRDVAYTPSDFGETSLSMEELAEILRLGGQLAGH